MSIRTLTRKPLVYMYVAGLVLLLVAASVWNAKVSTDPTRVFWGTIKQSLATSGVTVQASQVSGVTNVQQTVQYSLGANNLSHSITSLNENGTLINDEMIGTPTTDYTRYVSVKTAQKSASGKVLDFSHILGVWAKSASTGSATAGTASNVLFAQAALGTGLPLGGVAVPIANLSPALRSQLYGQIRGQDIFQPAISSVKQTTVNGRLMYTYNVSVQPILYASMMKHFAQSIGLHNFDSLDPNSFSGQKDLQIQMTIDVRARHLVTATVGNGTVKQTYSAYDQPVTMTLPKNPITTTELQTRLTNLQK